MSAAIAAAVTAIVATGYSIYSGERSMQAQKDAQERIDREKAAEKDRLDQIERDTRPEGESATVDYGASRDTKTESYNDFLIKKKTTSSLGTSGKSGLGTLSSSPLGM